MRRVVAQNGAELEGEVSAALRTNGRRTASRWERREVGHVSRRAVDKDPGEGDGHRARMLERDGLRQLRPRPNCTKNGDIYARPV